MLHTWVQFASDTESNLVDPRWHRKPFWEIATLKPAYVGLQLGDFLWNEFVRHVTFWWLKFHTLFSKRLKHVPWPQIASRTNFTNKLRHTKSLRLTVWTPILLENKRSNIRLEEFDIQIQKSNMRFQSDLCLRIPFSTLRFSKREYNASPSCS